MTNVIPLTRNLTPSDDAERFIALGVGQTSLYWRISLGENLTQATRRLQVCGAYNDFDPEQVVETIALYWEHVGEFTLAREGSIALYATLPYWRHQTLGQRLEAREEPPQWLTGQGERIGKDETVSVARALMGDLLEDDASEVSCRDDNAITTRVYSERPIRFPDQFGRPYSVRAWWD